MARPLLLALGAALPVGLMSGCPSDKSDADLTETAETVEGGPWSSDADGDGVASDADCDDQDESVYPGAEEQCDGVDDDCDGEVDEEALETFYADADGDGHGVDTATVSGCEAPAGAVETAGDCDDGDDTVYPGAEEQCNNVDDDCDGEVDDGIDFFTCYPDGDGDGYGDADAAASCCALGEAWVDADSIDCDDDNVAVHPGGREVCNLTDDDCDGVVDEVDEFTDSLCDLWEEHELSDADVKILGGAGERIGQQLTSLDANGDGYLDLLVGSEYMDLAGPGSGGAHLLEGPVTEGGRATDLAAATLAGPDPGAKAADELSSAKDADLDGYEDMWVAAPFASTSLGMGAVYLVLSPISGSLSLADADLVWVSDDDLASWQYMRVSGEGDLDGDGIPDLAIGAKTADSEPDDDSGRVWLTRIDETWGTRAISSAPTSFVAANEEEYLGSSVAIIGSTTGDGLDDLLVGGLGPKSLSGAGLVWVLEGAPEDGTWVIDDCSDARLVGETASSAGSSLADLGDMNGDGYTDYAIGAEGSDAGASGAGAVYIVHGPTGDRSSLSEADARLLGVVEASSVHIVAGGGDVDGDGNLDVVVGGYNIGDDLPGTAYLVRGPLEEGTTSLSEADAVFEGEDEEHRAGRALSLAGDTNRDGYSELVVTADSYGEEGADLMGAVYLYFGQPR